MNVSKGTGEGGGPGQREPWELGPTGHLLLGALLSGPSARLTATPEGIQDKIASSLSHPAAHCRPAIKESSGDPSARLCATQRAEFPTHGTQVLCVITHLLFL